MITLWIPREIDAFASMDWGHAKPGCIGWWICLPDVRYHVLREWKFQGLADEDIADGYHARTKDAGLKAVRYVAGDPSMWIRDGRNSKRGQSRAETFIRSRMPMRKAENARVDGWSRVHSMLRVPRDDDGRPIGEPILTIDASCVYLRRTLPAQRSDKTDADDLDTTGDDHGADMLRYGAMSRPNPLLARREAVVPPKGTAGALLADLRSGLGRADVLGAGNVR